MNISPMPMASPMGTLELLQQKIKDYTNIGFKPTEKLEFNAGLDGTNPVIRMKFKPTKNQTVKANLQKDPQGGVMGGVNYRYTF